MLENQLDEQVGKDDLFVCVRLLTKTNSLRLRCHVYLPLSEEVSVCGQAHFQMGRLMKKQETIISL